MWIIIQKGSRCYQIGNETEKEEHVGIILAFDNMFGEQKAWNCRIIICGLTG